MTGRENVVSAIEFKNPERIPCRLSVNFEKLIDNDTALINKLKNIQSQIKYDILQLWNQSYKQQYIDSNGCQVRIDERGVKWINNGHGFIVKESPYQNNWEFLKNYHTPDPENKELWERIDNNLKRRNGKYVLAAVWYSLFERLWLLRGFENTLIDPYINTEEFCELRDRIVSYNLKIIDLFIERQVDGILFSDDWGTETSLFINPDDWVRFFKESYYKMFSRAKDAGLHVWMHSCGNIEKIIPHLIEIGLDVLNPVQSRAMDVEILSKKFGGIICFNGGIDSQGVMVHGTPNQVKEHYRNLLKLFGSYNGGYIAGTDSNHPFLPQTPIRNIIALYETYLENI